MKNTAFLWIAVATALVLLIPLISMQFSSEMNWDETDFIVIGALLFGAGSFFVLVARHVTLTSHRILVGLMVLAAVLFLWAELAVGIFTNWGS